MDASISTFCWSVSGTSGIWGQPCSQDKDRPFSPLAAVGYYRWFLGIEGSPFSSLWCRASTTGAGQERGVVTSHPQTGAGKGGQVRPRREVVGGRPQVVCVLGRGRLIRLPHPTCGNCNVGCVLCPVFLSLW